MITRRKPSTFRVATNAVIMWALRIGGGVVYFLRMVGTDYYKIGFTSRDDVLWRLAELQTACPRRLEVVATVSGDEATEADFHRQYWQYRTDGGAEWFEIPPDKAKEFDNGNAKQGSYFGAVGGASAHDVRPIRGRQQYAVARSGEDVPGAGWGANDACPKYTFSARRGEHQERVSAVLREERQDDCPGHQQLHGD